MSSENGTVKEGEPNNEAPGQQVAMPPGQQTMVAPGQQAMMAPGQQPMMAPGQQAMMAPGGQYAYYNQGQMMPGQIPGQAPMMQQPIPGQPVPIPLMPRPVETIPGCPPGLEYLVHLDQLLVHQQIELAEMITNINFENKYMIKNTMGQQVYFARESSDACMRICCGPARGFTISITDNMGQEVLRVSRIFKCCAGCCWCAHAGNYCSFFIEVESPPGTVIGYVRQTQFVIQDRDDFQEKVLSSESVVLVDFHADASFASPHFDVQDADNQTVLKIRGHWCRCQTICCQNDIEFKIFTKDMSTQVGKVSKQWGGWLRENYTQADNFGVEWPADLDVKTKAVLLASTFLIDFMFFENKQQNKQNY